MVMLDLFIITILILAGIVGLYFALKPAHDQAMIRRATQREIREERLDRAKARWFPENRLSGNKQYTDVFVVLRTPKGVVIEERNVEIPIANGDPLYDELLYEAMDKARLRALTLNIQLEATE